ncbi:winged helix-turn-helix domain-containing protein [Enterococcus sp. CWB-B31]|uniref:winged helix-turn-helix domain-containing protein n=1 Tax=Enterococcus sp. CWB-B31 TaxID=2885159 RepID=UPI001E372DE0|nr:winged helix-turn-helix domain-containing protein [Enterococcus sp. CWB-B31]MCB5953908.1 winged helix-turn-helix domain-containing protein [Enterococcus sp. CWB-B31]
MYNIGITQPVEEFERTYVEKLGRNQYKLVTVDVNNMDTILSDLDGVLLKENEKNLSETCGIIMKIRERSNSFIWVLSEKPTAVQKVIYLHLGADGTFSNENEPEEMTLTIKNLLNRQKKASGTENDKPLDSKEEVQSGAVSHFKLLPNNLSVQIGKERTEVTLTRLEFKLLSLLYEHQSQGLSYKEIYENIWDDAYKGSKYRVANLIFHLREKLELQNVSSSIIKTVRSKGYMLSLN